MIDQSVMSAQPFVVISQRYQMIDKLGDGGMGTVYRVHDRLTGQIVALKQMHGHRIQLLATPQPDSAMLTQEFKFLASLHHPHIISVLDYGVDELGQPYYTMTLVEQAREFGVVASQRDLDGQIDLLLQMLRALAYLHRRGILHRDLKPSNVMVDAQGQVKVVDFGLATATGQQNLPAGTLVYMAPEVLRGESSVPQSDLYAVGIMAYEIFAGQRPFAGSNAIALMYNAIYEPLDVSRLTLSSDLVLILRRLLAPLIEDRYDSAEAVIQAFAEATGRPLVVETQATRESFLQAAQFVGRDDELKVLNNALIAASNSQGSAWLIGGESGVGKSRLLEEIQIQAMLRGALLLRGQAIAEGQAPYQIWRDAIRRLILQTNLSDYEASVLKPILPDINYLLNREVLDPPVIDAASLQIRLRAVIERIFEQNQFVVILLEDLHWADESLVILKWLIDLTRRARLLIIGTYRDDERPTLHQEFPTTQHIKLERLPSAAIAQLSASMLGEGGKSVDIIRMLERETEGNVFFIVEVVRTLAEEAGGLANVGSKTLPAQIFAGGVQTVIKRRLEKVPKEARPLMIAAAVFGRELDLEVLAAIMPKLTDYQAAIEDWLQQVAIVIEAEGDHFRFAHDKLREGLLTALDPAERSEYHRQIAEAIETIHPDSPEYFAALTYHWAEAHNATRTIRYATLAGQNALRAGSYREAIRLFQQAVALSDQTTLDNYSLGNLYHLLGDANWGQSDIAASVSANSKALEMLGYSLPQTRSGVLLGVIKPLLRHIRRRLLPVGNEQNKPYGIDHDKLIVAAASFYQLALSAYYNANLEIGLYRIFSGLDATERAGNSAAALHFQARYYSAVGFAAGDIGQQAIARSYFQRAKSRLQIEPDAETLSWVNYIYGLYLGGRGQWAECTQLLADAFRSSQLTGSIGLQLEINQSRLAIYYLLSRFSETTALIESNSQIAKRDGQIQATGRLLIMEAYSLFLRGKTDAAQNHYLENEKAIQLALRTGDHGISRIIAFGFLTELYTRLEQWDEALKNATLLSQAINESQTVSFVLANGAAAPIALFLILWEKQKNSQGKEPSAPTIFLPAYRQMASAALKTFHRKFTRHSVIGEPFENVYHCWFAWLAGNPQKAMKYGLLAIKAAQLYEMPHVEGLARYHLARFMVEYDPARVHHLKTAAGLFDEIGAIFEAERAREALLSGSGS